MTFAKLWQQILGREDVGIHDNFFELGGDSVLAIRFISRSYTEGYALTPGQLFLNQTIAELAAVIDAKTTLEPERIEAMRRAAEDKRVARECPMENREETEI
jgi:aryl carrier-like protein